MTAREADELRSRAKSAVQASRGWPADLHPGPAVDAVLAILARGCPEGEPVAWIIRHGEFGRTLDFHNLTEADRKSGYSADPLYAAPQPCPEGWVLVPKEPTGAMQDAARKSEAKLPMFKARIVYYAMIAAVPEGGA